MGTSDGGLINANQIYRRDGGWGVKMERTEKTYSQVESSQECNPNMKE